MPSGTTIGAISTVLSGTGWLTATASGDTVTVTANGSQLAPGTYSGVVTVIVPGAGASPLYIPVTLNVTPATSAITLSASTASFTVLAGSMSDSRRANHPSDKHRRRDQCSIHRFLRAQHGRQFPDGDAVQRKHSGNHHFVGERRRLKHARGRNLHRRRASFVRHRRGSDHKGDSVVSPAGTPVVLSITSGASLQPGAVSPGEIVTIFGNGIGPATPATGTSFTPTASSTVPTTLANVTVTFNNVPAPLIFVAQGQINAIVPYEVAGQTSVPVVVYKQRHYVGGLHRARCRRGSRHLRFELRTAAARERS